MAANPELLEAIAFFSVAVLAVLLLGIAFAGFWTAAADAKPLLLGEVLDHAGSDLLHAAILGADGRGFGTAVKRCANCTAQTRCRDWLTSGAHEGYEAFCPNSGFVARVKWLAA